MKPTIASAITIYTYDEYRDRCHLTMRQAMSMREWLRLYNEMDRLGEAAVDTMREHECHLSDTPQYPRIQQLEYELQL